MHKAPFLVPEPEIDANSIDPADRERVEDLFRSLGKALRMYQLYQGRSPVLEQFVGALRSKFTAIWDRVPALSVQVEEQEIDWEGEAVYQSVERADNLAFLFYRDGIRELTLLPGFEDKDLITFLGILARIHRIRSEEDDLLTLLWELDLAHLRYSYVDTLVDGIDPLLRSGEETSSLNPATVREDAAAETQSSISEEDFQEALYFLDEAELRELATEVRREDARDLWADVISALLDRLEDGGPERQQRVAGIFAELFPTLIGAANFAKGAMILRELAAVAAGTIPLPASIVRDIRSIFGQLGTRDAIEELIRTTEEVPGAASNEALSEFLGYFPPDALGPLIRSEQTAARPEVRRTIAAAIEALASAHRDRLIDLLGDSDPVLLAGAARWAGRLQVATAGTALAALLEHPDASVRLAAIVALQELRNSMSAAALPRCLEDPVRDVRIAAARALGELRYSPARDTVERVITSREIRDADLTERIAFFEAYGSLAAEAGVPLLDRMLNGKGWLGRREPTEIRACAALGLGKVRHASSTKALRSAAADSDPIVRSAVGRALRPDRP